MPPGELLFRSFDDRLYEQVFARFDDCTVDTFPQHFASKKIKLGVAKALHQLRLDIGEAAGPGFDDLAGPNESSVSTISLVCPPPNAKNTAEGAAKRPCNGDWICPHRPPVAA